MQNYIKGYFIKKYFLLFLVPFFLISCALKEPIKSQSATILIKTPTMKFYDKGFIKKYENRVELSVFSAGVPILNLNIYEDRICKNTFKCQNLKEFNAQNLNSNYNDNFLINLLSKDDKNINFKDSENRITIKIQKD